MLLGFNRRRDGRSYFGYTIAEGNDTYSLHFDYESVPVSECQDNACGNLVEGY